MDHLFVGTRQKFKRFFEGHNLDFVRRLILKMEYGRFELGQNQEQGLECVCVQKASTVPKMIYFVISGKLMLCSFDGIAPYMELAAGAVYGEPFVLFGVSATYTLKYDPFFSKTDRAVDIYKVEASDFLGILRDYRCVYQTLRQEGLRKRSVYRRCKRKAIERLGLPFLRDRSSRVGLLKSVLKINVDQINAANKPKEESKEWPQLKPEDSQPVRTEEAQIQLTTEAPLITERSPEENKLETLEHAAERAPKGATNVFSLFKLDGGPQPLCEREAPPVIEEGKESMTAEPLVKAKTSLFNVAERKGLDHNALLAVEYDYNSEDEFGTLDVFERKQVIKEPKQVEARLSSIKSELDSLNDSIDKMSSELERQLVALKNKALN